MSLPTPPDHPEDTELAHQPDASLISSSLLETIKYVDRMYDETNYRYVHVATEASIAESPAERAQPLSGHVMDCNTREKDYHFVVERDITKRSSVSFTLMIQSPELLKVCKSVMGSIPDVSWTATPVTLSPRLLVAFFPQLKQHEVTLLTQPASLENTQTLAALGVLLAYLEHHYSTTLATIGRLISHLETTFDLLDTVFIPGDLLVTSCPTTGEPWIVRLHNGFQDQKLGGEVSYKLVCEYLDAKMNPDPEHGNGPAMISEDAFKMYSHTVELESFTGVAKITTLHAYPVKYHANWAELSSLLVERGRKWAALATGQHHMQYCGMAVGTSSSWSVNSRIILDKAYYFGKRSKSGKASKPDVTASDATTEAEDVAGAHPAIVSLSEEKLRLATPILYGYSLVENEWMRFNVRHVSPIEWNDEAFSGLILPVDGHKDLLRALVDAHAGGSDAMAPDFVRGKGRGLIIGLHGPPGVGKTLSAEATSEHLRRPLMSLTSGKISDGNTVEVNLRRTLDMAGIWRAILLIDEADVFLERRATHDLERNALVSAFLTQLETYSGIVFLTTNRLETFDEAMLSRMHLKLTFGPLTAPTKSTLWRAFLKKAGMPPARIQAVAKLHAETDLNGRQIRNICQLARYIAKGLKEQLGEEHVERALNLALNEGA